MKKYFVILTAVGFLLYLPSLFGPFLWDDEDFVFANKYVEHFQIEKFFTDNAIAGRGKISNYYRPVQETTYAIVHFIFGFNPFWYHLVNIATHILAACAIYYFFSLIKKTEGWRETESLPFLTALLFLIHPLQTEAVSYISGLSDPLFVLLGFLSLIFFLKKRLLFSLLFFLLSLLSKETAIVFLPLLALLNYKKTAPFILPTISYLWYHFTHINQFNIQAAWGNNAYAHSTIVRLLTFVQNLSTYVRLLLFPKDLFLERDYTTPIQTNFLNPGLLIFFAVNAAIIYFLFRRRSKLLTFCYLAFFISLAPYSGLVLINGIFYEHFLYLPLVFFFAFSIIIFSKFLKNKLVLYLVAGYLLLLAGRNIVRQLDWTDAVRFYSQTLAHAPQSIRIINGLGIAYADRGNLDEAIRVYLSGIRVDPHVPNLYHNLANAYLTKGDLTQAEKYYLKALEVDPNFIFSYQALVSLYQQTGQKEKLVKLGENFKKINKD